MNFEKLFKVLVVAGASTTVGLACSSDDSDTSDNQQPSTGSGGDDTGSGGAPTGGSAGGDSAGGTAAGGDSAGGTAAGGEAGASAGGSSGGSGDSCACEPPNDFGWVFCNGACCWLPNQAAGEPCCDGNT